MFKLKNCRCVHYQHDCLQHTLNELETPSHRIKEKHYITEITFDTLLRSPATNRGKIKTTLVRISYLSEGEKPNNFPCCCLEQRLLADARAVILLHIWASVTECDSERQGEGKTRLRFSCSRMTGCRLDTRLADGISKSFHEPSGMCTMITNHTYNKARRAASQGGWGERAGGKSRGKKRKPRGTNFFFFFFFPKHRTLRIISTLHPEPFHSLQQLLQGLCVHSPAPPQPASHHCSPLLINSTCN